MLWCIKKKWNAPVIMGCSIGPLCLELLVWSFPRELKTRKKNCSARMARSKPIRKQTHKHDHQHHQRGHVDSGFDVVMQNQEVKCPCDDGTLQLLVHYVLSSWCGAFQENWRREKFAVQESQEANPSGTKHLRKQTGIISIIITQGIWLQVLWCSIKKKWNENFLYDDGWDVAAASQTYYYYYYYCVCFQNTGKFHLSI